MAVKTVQATINGQTYTLHLTVQVESMKLR